MEALAKLTRLNGKLITLVVMLLVFATSRRPSINLCV